MHSRRLSQRLSRWIVGGLVLALVIAGSAFIAAELEGAESPHNDYGMVAAESAAMQTEGDTYPRPDQACRLCHSNSEAEIEFPSGETLPVLVDIEAVSASAHGAHADSPLLCTDCHALTDYTFPHTPVEDPDLRTYEVSGSATCERCHQQPHITGHPGPESENPVVCTDCHQSHEVAPVDQWQSGEGSDVCVDCHTESGIHLTDSLQLAQIVRDGLFTDRADSDYCLACHRQPGLTMTFENGDVVSVTVDPDALHGSVHGADNSWQALECADCHGPTTYPHEPLSVESAREYSLQQYTTCARCHENHFELTMDSVHGNALDEGNLEAAVCTDCHGSHDTPPPGEPRERISHTCQQCHSGIFDVYKDSVHGEALLIDSDPDVPVCIDCHGVHDINDPTTDLARLRSPELCASCHADDELMSRHDISTDVFDTYVADFHGTTVQLFDPEDPNAASNKAVCYDCHGVHDIRPVDDPESGIKVNLLHTCQQCHPDATENFPDAWTSHYQPSLENNPLVYMVDTFYAIIIPVTLGALSFLVIIDIYRRVRTRLSK